MKVLINNLWWEVNIVPSHAPELYVDGSTCRGACWFETQRMFLSDELNVATALRVIVHEVTHAFLWSTQIKVPEVFDEEEVCEFVAIYCMEIEEVAHTIWMELYPEILDDEEDAK